MLSKIAINLIIIAISVTVVLIASQMLKPKSKSKPYSYFFKVAFVLSFIPFVNVVVVCMPFVFYCMYNLLIFIPKLIKELWDQLSR